MAVKVVGYVFTAMYVLRTIGRLTRVGGWTILLIVLGLLLSLAVAKALRKLPCEMDSPQPDPRSNVPDGLRKRRLTKFELAKVAQTQWDAVVVGSGIGGLTCAAMLANEGKKVLVLEQHDVAGGCTHTFTDHGVEFDTGLHYVGGPAFGTGDHRSDGLNLLMATVTRGAPSPLEWHRMDDAYDVAVSLDSNCTDGYRRFDVVSGKERLIAALIKEFPSEANGIRAYFNAIDKQQKTAGLFFAERVIAGWLPGWIRQRIEPLLTAAFNEGSDRTVREVLESIVQNDRLRSLLTYCWGNYGLPPSCASWAIHSMVVNHYLEGAAFPLGGCSEIACRIIPTIEAAGGRVYVNAAVREIKVDSSCRVSGVVLDRDDDMFISVPVVISAAGARCTFENLLTETSRDRVVTPLKALHDPALCPSSTSHIMLFVVLNGMGDELGLPASNFWISTGNTDVDSLASNYEKSAGTWEADFPAVFLSFPSAKDPLWHERNPGKSTAHIIAPAEISWFDNWAETKLKKRGDAYLALKEELSLRLLQYMYTLFPHLKGKVLSHELGTPLSNKHYLASPNGESYGIACNPDRFRQQWLGPSTNIEGLFLTGQDIVSMGVMGAATAGFLSAIAVEPRVAWSNLRLLTKL